MSSTGLWKLALAGCVGWGCFCAVKLLLDQPPVARYAVRDYNASAEDSGYWWPLVEAPDGERRR